MKIVLNNKLICMNVWNYNVMNQKIKLKAMIQIYHLEKINFNFK